MDLLSSNKLKDLMQQAKPPCLSIYMPTERMGKQVTQNRIRFKNRLREAERLLNEAQQPSTQVSKLLEPLRSLESSSDFWQHQAEGLAVFSSLAGTKYYRLPESFPELTVSGDHFHLKPLLPLITADGTFAIMTLSKNDVRLYQGSRFRVEEINLPDIPPSPMAEMDTHLFEKQLQFHTRAPRSSGQRQAMFFGSGDADADLKKMIRAHFNRVDKELPSVFAGQQLPLVLAGVDYLTDIFRDVSDHKQILDETVAGSADALSIEELHKSGFEIVSRQFEENRRQALEKFQALKAKEPQLASGELEVVVPAAVQGRVESLFVTIGEQMWGRILSDSGEVELHEKRRPDDQDLLNLAAVYTYINRGEVYSLEAADVPGESLIAAVLRY
jgi:hypothetical protein